ncbi:hypothetical protein M0R45_015522 [Rubus argutus]|uniref:non-specific serine/threonine protein kinase n=1 Tax=Rubus argutus TaxID=59490 RepID=A0AAW1XPU4_RUBAR
MDLNYLTGTMPIEIGYLPKLETLYLHDNNLSGLIPSSIFNMSTITIIELGINQLSGSIPPNIGLGLPNLQQLYLSENKLSGCIPNNIGNLSSLILLSLEDNQLSRTIPSSVGRLQNLQGFFLDYNNLQGHIPDELCQLNHLYKLFLHENQFSGSIPSCLGNLTGSLRSLSLGFNLLNSTIASTLWELTYILELYLSSNSLIGPLSDGVGNLKVVRVMDLSDNRLSGTIPSSICGLQNLVNLSLENNNLRGPIPSSLGTLISLEFLDFSRNNLSGVIPKSLEMLSHLRYMNLSFNRLQGEIPTDGPFRNFSTQSFVSNDGLCGASRFYVPPCKGKTRRSILKYVIPEILSAVLLVTTIWMLMLRKKKNVEASTEIALMPQLLCERVSYQELLSATNVFNESNLLGIGGFGSVYKGTLSNEKNVAIKVFNLELEGAFTSFDVECEVLSNVRHRNLIKVIGCCSQIDFKAIILDYMPNGSLEKWLYSLNFSLNILQRLNIMIDVASALQYLHHSYETPIVHCDLKPSNILLDDDKVAHVSDFGIAKLLGRGDSKTQTITLATIGYMAPEYGMEGIITRRGDVYSFGIVLLETFTAKKPTDEIFGERSLKQWITNSLFAEEIVEVVDTNLLGIEEDLAFVSKIKCLSSIMRLALACCAESPEERINMQEALAALNKIKIKFFMDSAGGEVLNQHLVGQPPSD